MSFDKLKEQIALLRLANLTHGDLNTIAFYMAADWSTLQNIGATRNAVAAKLNLQHYAMEAEHRRLVCAAATMLLIEAEEMTPFKQWLGDTGNCRRTPSEIAVLREAFEAGSKLNG